MRCTGTVISVAATVLCGLGTLFALAGVGDYSVLFFIIGLTATVVFMLFAVLFYAVIGWFGDSLSLLLQIARSTNAQPGL